MRQLTFIAGAFGIGLAIWMLARFGLHDILGLVAAGGWSIPAIIAFHATQVCASAQAWRLLAQTGRAPCPLPILSPCAARAKGSTTCCP
ncbi:hypothetical protein RAA17_02420 [Komagataeibacter rhaeticus]|nr:hypothetical protein [Komagataeibacter rhaeticus]